MAKYRDNISSIAIDQEYIEVKEEYIEYIKVDDVNLCWMKLKS